MINFNGDSIWNLKPIDVSSVKTQVFGLLIEGEEIVAAFRTIRDQLVFTNKRIISIDVQGLTGLKKSFAIMPYSKVQFFTIQTPGFAELVSDSELYLMFSNGFTAKFEFRGSVDIGALVGPNGKSLLATVVKSDTVRVDFSMTGLDYLKSKARNVNLGQKDSTRKWDPYITITLADNTQYPLRGLVDFADPQVDPETGTFSVRAEMANPDRILLPGQFTKVRLLLDVREDATVVPTKSVVIEKGGAYIFVIRPDSIAERRLIELGPEVNNRVIVERGVVPGEKIVVEGFHKLTHGDKVDPVPVPEKSSATETEASEK